jgi:hypothetical protein
MMLRIERPIDGQVCNRWDGQTTPEGLRIEIAGTCNTGAVVSVNGAPATVQGNRFVAGVTLTSRENTLEIASGGETARLKVFYDASGVRRCRISVDDCIYFLRDTARYARDSIFENGFLAFWREMHREFGTKVHFNVYYRDLDTGFTLPEFPDRFRGEFEANAGWLHLTFHAIADKPDWPYREADYATIDRDFKLVTNEIVRFAGPNVLSNHGTLHWGTAPIEGCRALRDNGMTGLVGYFRLVDGEPFVAYYLNTERTAHLSGRDCWIDTVEGITFIQHDLVMDPLRLDEIKPHLEVIHADPHRSEVLELLVHEQYFHPRWPDYHPEQALKVRTALQWAAEHEYRPVFYNEGPIAGA